MTLLLQTGADTVSVKCVLLETNGVQSAITNCIVTNN